jgi:hypothetical protein
MRRPGIILTFNREESNKTPLGVAFGKKEGKKHFVCREKMLLCWLMASAAAANFLSLLVPAALQPGTHAARAIATDCFQIMLGIWRGNKCVISPSVENEKFK